MKKISLYALVATMLIGSCAVKEEPFAFVVGSESVVEGNPLPVSVTITKGPSSGYLMSSTVETYDIVNSTAQKTGYNLLDGELRADGVMVNFEDNGKRDFHVDGLPAGTYRIVISLSRGESSIENSVVTVVQRKDEKPNPGIDPPTPVDIPVETFEILGLVLQDGIVNLKPGDEKWYPLSWKPDGATMTDFSVVSSDENVAKVRIENGMVVVSACGEGRTDITVSVDRGPSTTFGVVVKKPDVYVSGFEISGLSLDGGKLKLKDNDVRTFPLVWEPADASVLDFVASTSDAKVAQAVVSDGALKIQALYPGVSTITVAVTGGPSRNFIVHVSKDVVVTIEWLELSATDTQIATKTFPCYLQFSSDSDKAFPTPITWTVTMKGVVNVTGKDTQSVTSKEDIKFFGNRVAQYDVLSNILIPCYSIYRTSAFTLSLTLSMLRNASLDPEFWNVSYVEKYKTQDARINEYITGIQQ